MKPGEWVAVSGVGGLGHMAVQYAKAMGMHCVAIDTRDAALTLAKEIGADVAVNATAPDAAAQVVAATGGVHGVSCHGGQPRSDQPGLRHAAQEGHDVPRRLPPGRFAMPIFDTVLKRITVRGSIVGTRQDLAESLQFAAEGKVKAHYSLATLPDINDVFARLKAGKVDGRIVLDMVA